MAQMFRRGISTSKSSHKASQSGLQISTNEIGWAETLMTASPGSPTSQLKSHCSPPSQPAVASELVSRLMRLRVRSLCLNIGLDNGIQYSPAPPPWSHCVAAYQWRRSRSRMSDSVSSPSVRDALPDVWLCECTSYNNVRYFLSSFHFDSNLCHLFLV